jgi:hypothetical protein
VIERLDGKRRTSRQPPSNSRPDGRAVSGGRASRDKGNHTERATVRKRYEPKLPPADSFAFSESPLNATTAVVKVWRWHSFHGVPWLFMVVGENGRQPCDPFPYEPDALAHAEAFDLALMFRQFESELPEPDTQDQSDPG